MFIKERQEKILTILQEKKAVSVNELIKDLDFSPATIRADLKTLSEKGLLTRTHGGATFKEKKEATKSFQENFSDREQTKHEEKVLIANEALHFIHDQECIILDASSSCFELAKLLNEANIRLTVITNGLNVAQLLKDNTCITTILLGGVINKNSNAIEGTLGADLLSKVNIDRAFLSPNAFNLSTGLTDFSLYEVELKKEMALKSDKIIALIDYSKLEKSSIATFATANSLYKLITNAKADKSIIQNYIYHNIDVILV